MSKWIRGRTQRQCMLGSKVYGRGHMSRHLGYWVSRVFYCMYFITFYMHAEIRFQFKFESKNSIRSDLIQKRFICISNFSIHGSIRYAFLDVPPSRYKNFEYWGTGTRNSTPPGIIDWLIDKKPNFCMCFYKFFTFKKLCLIKSKFSFLSQKNSR